MPKKGQSLILSSDYTVGLEILRETKASLSISHLKLKPPINWKIESFCSATILLTLTSLKETKLTLMLLSMRELTMLLVTS